MCKFHAILSNSLLAILLIVFSSQPSQNLPGDINIAIIDFKGVGVEPNEVAMITDKFRNTLLDNASFKIMERSIVSEILKEQGFQQTGACNEISCMVKAGQLLGVNYLVAGRVSRAAEIISFSARLIDVASGAILSSVSFESRNNLFSFLSNEIPEYARVFSQKIKTIFGDFSKNVETGTLFIETSSPDADIFIDNEPANQKTPATLLNIKSGKHWVFIKTKNMIGSSEVVVQAGRLNKIAIQMKNAFSSLIITTNPNNAEVFIDGNVLANSPLEKDSIPPGDHEIKIMMEGYEPIREVVKFEVLKKMEKHYTLNPLSFLRLTGPSDSVNFFIDGKKVDEPQNGILKVIAGQHKIFFKKENWHETELQFLTKQFDTIEVPIRLAPKEGMLDIYSFPVQSEVIIENQSGAKVIGVTPFLNVALVPGKYSIEYSQRKYRTLLRYVNLIPGRKLTLSDTLKNLSDEFVKWEIAKNRNKNLNFYFSGIGEIKMQKPVSGYLLVSAGVVSDALVGISGYQVASHYFQKKDAMLPEERTYFKNRQKEDTYWLIGTVISSIVFRYAAYKITDKSVF
jgi:TolB-like protein